MIRFQKHPERRPKDAGLRMVRNGWRSVLRTVPVPDENIFGREDFVFTRITKCQLRFLQLAVFGFRVAASLPFGFRRNPQFSGPYKYHHRDHKVSHDPTKTMSKPKTHEYAMTLRLENQMADELEDIAFTLRLSKAGFVRRSIRRALEHARRHEVPLLNKRVLEAIRP
jgi:hypothetical protein